MNTEYEKWKINVLIFVCIALVATITTLSLQSPPKIPPSTLGVWCIGTLTGIIIGKFLAKLQKYNHKDLLAFVWAVAGNYAIRLTLPEDTAFYPIAMFCGFALHFSVCLFLGVDPGILVKKKTQ